MRCAGVDQRGTQPLVMLRQGGLLQAQAQVRRIAGPGLRQPSEPPLTCTAATLWSTGAVGGICTATKWSGRCGLGLRAATAQLSVRPCASACWASTCCEPPAGSALWLWLALQGQGAQVRCLGCCRRCCCPTWSSCEPGRGREERRTWLQRWSPAADGTCLAMGASAHRLAGRNTARSQGRPSSGHLASAVCPAFALAPRRGL